MSNINFPEAPGAPLNSPAFTGIPAAPTATPLTDDTQIATTAYSDDAVAVEEARAKAAEALLAPLASPALTGTPTAPTAPALTDDTQIATTAYSDTAVGVETARAEDAEALLVTGPGSAVSSDFVLFNGTTGKIVKDGGLSLSVDGTMSADSNSLIPSQKAVVTYAAALTGLVVQTTNASGGSLASGAIGQSTLTFAPTFTILSVACNGPLRLRLYSTAAAQTADLNRPNTVPPTPGVSHGVICDLYLQTSGQYTSWNLSPVAGGCNDDSPQTSNCYCSITNLNSITASPTTAITWI
jgi:hypothetical protein